MLAENQIKKISRGRPRKLSEQTLANLMEKYIVKTFVTVNSGDVKLVARKSDAEIADEISKATGVRFSAVEVCVWRKKHRVESHFGRGGKRSGAGRPPASQSSKNRTVHKLTISDYALVQACSSAYNFEQGKWNQWTWKYEKLPRYVPKFRQDGLRTYTPVMPFPDAYSKAQKYGALKGQ